MKVLCCVCVFVEAASLCFLLLLSSYAVWLALYDIEICLNKSKISCNPKTRKQWSPTAHSFSLTKQNPSALLLWEVLVAKQQHLIKRRVFSVQMIRRPDWSAKAPSILLKHTKQRKVTRKQEHICPQKEERNKKTTRKQTSPTQESNTKKHETLDKISKLLQLTHLEAI